MIRFLFRFVGFLILAGGFIALIYDGTKSIAGSALVFTPVGQIWNNVHSSSLQLLQPAIERHVSEWLWDPVILNILTAPAWLVFAILGAILMLIGRKKKPLIGYARD
jgi:hypothetical protein